MNSIKKLFALPLIFSFFLLSFSSGLMAKEEKSLLFKTTIDLNKKFSDSVKHEAKIKKTNNLWSYRIQALLMFYAYVMHQSSPETRVKLINETQKYVGGIATEEGLRRVKLLKKSNFSKKLPKEKFMEAFVISFNQEGKSGHSLEISPMQKQVEWLPLALLSLYQESVDTASEGALRLLAVSTGAINKWYRENDAGDINSLSQAPSYALKLALDILAQFSSK